MGSSSGVSAGSVRSGRGRRAGREDKLGVGSWNIGTLLGKSVELVKILKKRRINIACVQETKWVGSKARDVDGYKLWFRRMGSKPYLAAQPISNRFCGLEFPNLYSVAIICLTSIKPFEWFKNFKLGVNMFSDVIPDEIGLISSLEVVVLSNNSLQGKIPSSIGRLRNLQRLYLSNE
ncbi:hypothetical protein FXO37_04417 [Capsicum annuum]|nr:hypothetical protein FXO37_04417 [Capsicum annuum]